jgi:ketosteroid isomerase-like protein
MARLNQEPQGWLRRKGRCNVDGVVVVVTAIRGHGRGSDAPMEAEASWVYEVRDGLIVRDRAFRSKGEALEAAGPSE